MLFWFGSDRPSGLLSFVPALLSILTTLSLPSSSVSLSYFTFAVLMRECLGKHSCMSSPFPERRNRALFFSHFGARETKHVQGTLLWALFLRWLLKSFNSKIQTKNCYKLRILKLMWRCTLISAFCKYVKTSGAVHSICVVSFDTSSEFVQIWRLLCEFGWNSCNWDFQIS